MLRASLPSSIEICQHIEPEAGTVLADPSQLHQIIINLCANAEYAMRQTGGVLEVHLEAVKVDTALAVQHPTLHLGPHVRLTVRDTGQGMPPDAAHKADLDYAPCICARWNSQLNELMLDNCSAFAAAYKKDPRADVQENVMAARFFVILALAERGDFEKARPLADALIADSDAWDEELRKLIATWPTD